MSSCSLFTRSKVSDTMSLLNSSSLQSKDGSDDVSHLRELCLSIIKCAARLLHSFLWSDLVRQNSPIFCFQIILLLISKLSIETFVYSVFVFFLIASTTNLSIPFKSSRSRFRDLNQRNQGFKIFPRISVRLQPVRHDWLNYQLVFIQKTNFIFVI